MTWWTPPPGCPPEPRTPPGCAPSAPEPVWPRPSCAPLTSWLLRDSLARRRSSECCSYYSSSDCSTSSLLVRWAVLDSVDSTSLATSSRFLQAFQLTCLADQDVALRHVSRPSGRAQFPPENQPSATAGSWIADRTRRSPPGEWCCLRGSPDSPGISPDAPRPETCSTDDSSSSTLPTTAAATLQTASCPLLVPTRQLVEAGHCNAILFPYLDDCVVAGAGLLKGGVWRGEHRLDLRGAGPSPPSLAASRPYASASCV